MLSNSKVSRLEYIDMYKSFGIVLMIMGHIGYGNKFDYFIHAFHMPMFFFVSGFLFKHRTKEELPSLSFLLKKIKTLIVPYIFFGALHYIIYMIEKIYRGETISINPIKHLLFINTDGLPRCGALWFLTALFAVDIIFFIIDRYVKNPLVMGIIIIPISILGNIANSVLSVELPYALGAASVGIGLFYIGYLIKKIENTKYGKYLLNMSWGTIPMVVMVSILIFINGYINMREGKYAIIPLFWINSVLASIVLLNIAKYVSRFLKNGIFKKWMCSIGKNSIVYVCLNQISIFAITLCIDSLDLPLLISKVLILVITLMVLFLLGLLFTKTKLKHIIGKQ